MCSVCLIFYVLITVFKLYRRRVCGKTIIINDRKERNQMELTTPGAQCGFRETRRVGHQFASLPRASPRPKHSNKYSTMSAHKQNYEFTSIHYSNVQDCPISNMWLVAKRGQFGSLKVGFAIILIVSRIYEYYFGIQYK